MDKQLIKISKYLSFILRHKPEAIGLVLNEKGWGDIATIIKQTTNIVLTRDLIEVVVQTNDKQRFSISDDGQQIRANQGHTINVDLDLEPIQPPEFLMHGTVARCLDSIKQQGLSKQKRHHVHLSESITVAEAVGRRYGQPIILEISAKLMQQDGYLFYRSKNNVWLVDSVPAKYINIL